MKRLIFYSLSFLLLACGGYRVVRVDESEREKIKREGIERSLARLEVDQRDISHRVEEGFNRTADQQKRVEQRLGNIEKSLGEEVERLQRRLAEFGNGLEQLRVDLVTLQGWIEKEKHRVSLSAQKIEDHAIRLSQFSSELTQEKDQREKKISELSSREATLSTRVETLATDLRTLSQSLQNSSNKLIALSSALDGFQKVSTAQINELTKNVSQFSRIVESLGVKTAAQIAEQNKRLADLDQVSARVSDQGQKIADLSGRVEEFQKASAAQINELTKNVSQFSRIVESLGVKTAAEIAEQNKRLVDLDQVSARASDEGQKIADLSGRVEEFQAASTTQINELIQTVRTLSTTISELGTKMAIQVDGQAQVLDRTVKRLESVEAKLGLKKKPSGLSGEEGAEQRPPPVKGDPQGLFDQAYAEFEKGEHERALVALRNFIPRFPDSELVADAHYLIGEIYFIRMEFPKAIEAYEKVITGYPASKRAVSALLKEGLAYAELQQISKAKTTLRRIIEVYPQTAEATRAKEKLAGLR